ncbi:hypothetical protein TSAR_004044 [Trichomalopsis sarcophagae]|uniref:Transcription factor CBF/NF-Y/archaeal histone domain-containing protein n=1 Tax=Trichomalopsis sarcophagae TaxID=543379 RepID=A0A232ETJ5_9HYME|nr:hypothetical protein TSAR_004044 [Trichomalopsis sarcophagae]
MDGQGVEEVDDIGNELNLSNVSALVEEVNQEREDLHEESETAEAEVHQDEEPAAKLTQLPIGRVKKIAKSDSDINLINQEAIFLITKATELFIDCLSKESYKYTHQSKKKTIQKKDVQSAIDNVDALMFLDGVN